MSALDDFVTQSSKSYLQSVVFVDDRIYYRDKPIEVSSSHHGFAGLKPQVITEEIADASPHAASHEPPSTENTNARPESQTDSNPSYHPRQLMESFAQQGIVCALYEPLEHFKTDRNSDLFRLCERADIVILDWDLHNDGGEGASALLTELIQAGQEQSPHHVRLCAIYTDKPNLHTVLNSLYSNLIGKKCSIDTLLDGRLHLIAGATRISIFGKPGSVGRTAEERQYEVSEKELAEKIISEFARLHHGILPAFALHGLASVRKNTKRLLDKFRSELDGAFLLHRALVLAESEAFDELPELLSDEIRAVLEDMWPGSTKLQQITEDIAKSLELAEPQNQWKTVTGANLDAKLGFRKMLEVGISGLTNTLPTWAETSTIKKSGARAISPASLKDFETMLTLSGQSSTEHLAMLFCNRTQYGAAERTLRFGTIVRHKKADSDNWSFSVCLMPICDSQRLKTETSFPFWRLRDNAKSGNPGKRHGIAISIGNQTFSLAAGGKIRDALWQAPFKPGPKGWVPSVEQSGQFIFETLNHTVEWVAQLKPLHAQRIAAYMGAEVSRVGLVESEWLRLFCDR